jgi:hypothetical protein
MYEACRLAAILARTSNAGYLSSGTDIIFLKAKLSAINLYLPSQLAAQRIG